MRNRPIVLSATPIIASLLSAALLIGCSKTAPQRPTRLGEQRVDTTLLRMMAMNEHMSEQADRAVLQWVREQPDLWSQLECGAWYRKSSVVQRIISEGQTIRLGMQVYDLRGRLICDSERTVIAGKEEGIPTAVAEALKEGLIGDHLTLACPWYVGFGPHGNDLVKAYENIIINVYIK